jgi:hypothetical protein
VKRSQIAFLFYQHIKLLIINIFPYLLILDRGRCFFDLALLVPECLYSCLISHWVK